MKKIGLLSAIVFFLVLFFCSCNEKEKSGKIALQFKFNVDGEELVFSEKNYHNAAGNFYQVDELKFFISDVVFHHKEGRTLYVTDNEGVHYTDNTIQSTLLWNVKDFFTVGEYDAISFTFGLSHDNNVDGKFVNAPESNMAWSPALGGGYHYMQLNGKWQDNGIEKPLNIHSGISKIYSSDSTTISYKHHFFTVTFTDANFSILEDQTTTLQLTMNVNNWFKEPIVYDFTQWGSEMMGNLEAQDALQKNGQTVFSLFVK